MNIKKKPIVSYYKNFDPTLSYEWINKLTEINIINTKVLNQEFCDIVLQNKNKIFLHVTISGMGKTPFEPNIPSVKTTFDYLKYLVNNRFPINQILIIINPILPNDNGLKALKLLLKVLTEYRELRLRWVRTNLLTYKTVADLYDSKFKQDKKNLKYYKEFGGKYIISNNNILNRMSELKPVLPYLFKQDSFYKEYYKLLDQYRSIINIDAGDMGTISVRELQPFGYNNIWTDENNIKTKIIDYEKNNKFKPIVNIISKGGSKTIRCKNRCKLCPYIY